MVEEKPTHTSSERVAREPTSRRRFHGGQCWIENLTWEKSDLFFSGSSKYESDVSVSLGVISLENESVVHAVMGDEKLVFV
jgi:hypothetical protein